MKQNIDMQLKGFQGPGSPFICLRGLVTMDWQLRDHQWQIEFLGHCLPSWLSNVHRMWEETHQVLHEHTNDNHSWRFNRVSVALVENYLQSAQRLAHPAYRFVLLFTNNTNRCSLLLTWDKWKKIVIFDLGPSGCTTCRKD